MSFFSSNSGSRNLAEAIDPRLGLDSSRRRDVPMGNVIRVLCEFPGIKDAIVAFKDTFFEGEAMLPQEHKVARYVEARKAFDAIGDVYIDGHYNLRKFIEQYNIVNQDERSVKIEALIVFLPSLNYVYNAVNTFLIAFKKNADISHTINEAQQASTEDQDAKNTERVDRYKRLDSAFDAVRTFPVDNILDTDLLEVTG
ncbi:MAG: hypothetical protein WC004_04755 [Candidatus Absconditabacterales bacterium]